MARSVRQQPASWECPQCGAEVPAGRLACRECGSDAATGWKPEEEVEYQAVELPQEDASARRGYPALVWWIVLLALVAFVVAAVGLR